ncbi:MAG: hypothetical protein WCN21_14580, partial [Comamonadaceae bacterium]
LIVLVAMTLGGIALVRSVSTASVIAGNLAFQQSATLNGDAGVEAAVTALNNYATLNQDSSGQGGGIGYSNGYNALMGPASQSPAAGQSWDTYWNVTLANYAFALPADPNTGNQVSYVIDRLCQSGGSNCYASPLVRLDCGNDKDGPQFSCPSMTFYRITSRIAGPRGTVSYVQAVYAK